MISAEEAFRLSRKATHGTEEDWIEQELEKIGKEIVNASKGGDVFIEWTFVGDNLVRLQGLAAVLAAHGYGVIVPQRITTAATKIKVSWDFARSAA